MSQFVVADSLLIRDGQILLAKRSKGLSESPDCWSIPGGGVVYGESVQEALIREIKEELNLDLIDYKLWNVYSAMSDSYQIIALYFVGSAVGDIILQEKEISEAKWFDINLDLLDLELAFNQKQVIKDYLTDNGFNLDS